jgi:hypothetical protein
MQKPLGVNDGWIACQCTVTPPGEMSFYARAQKDARERLEGKDESPYLSFGYLGRETQIHAEAILKMTEERFYKTLNELFPNLRGE